MFNIRKTIGFTIIEILLSISVFGAIATGVFIYASKVDNISKNVFEIKKAESIKKAVDTLYTVNGNYLQVNNANVLQSGGLIGEETFTTRFGTPITLAPTTITNPGDAFSLSYTQVPKSQCASITNSIYSLFGRGTVNGTVLTENAQGQPNIAQIVDLCNNNESNTILFNLEVLVKNCLTQHVSWGVKPNEGCTAQVATTTTAFSTIAVSPIPSSRFTGNANFRCINGKLIQQGGSTCTPPPCIAGLTESYTDPITKQTCAFQMGGITANGSNRSTTTLTASDAVIKDGNVTVQCSKGNYSKTPTSISCNKKCVAGSQVNWTDPTTTSTCYAKTTTTRSGGYIIPSSTMNNERSGYSGLGGATARCDSSTGAYTYGNGNCKRACPSQTINWTVGALNCSGVLPQTEAGNSSTANSAGPNTGSATFTCNTASNTFIGPLSGATCVPPPPPPAPMSGATGTFRMYTYHGFGAYRPTMNFPSDPCNGVRPPVPPMYGTTCVYSNGSNINTIR